MDYFCEMETGTCFTDSHHLVLQAHHHHLSPTTFLRRSTYRGTEGTNLQCRGFPEERSKNSFEHPILDYIARTDADIVCLQEYLVSKTGRSIFSQRDINRILNKYPYHSVTDLESSGKYHISGLACFSKYPIEKTHKVVFESSYNGAAIYTININGQRYTVANVHLESNSIQEEDKKLYSDFIQNSDSIKLKAVTTNIRTPSGEGLPDAGTAGREGEAIYRIPGDTGNHHLR